MHSHYWIWCPVLGPIVGALFGALIYDALLYNGTDNIFIKQYVLHLHFLLLCDPSFLEATSQLRVRCNTTGISFLDPLLASLIYSCLVLVWRHPARVGKLLDLHMASMRLFATLCSQTLFSNSARLSTQGCTMSQSIRYMNRDV